MTQHLEATNPLLMALTPPTSDELENKDVDVRGPDGFALSIRGVGRDRGDTESS